MIGEEAAALKESLRRLEAESWTLYLRELRRLDVAVEEVTADDWLTPVGQFLRSDPGHPLGHGMPSGTPIAGGDDAGSHIGRWMTLIRADPCAYCLRAGGTVDHIVPQSEPDRETYTWLNMIGSCGSCNRGKDATPLLEYMLRRARSVSRAERLALAA